MELSRSIWLITSLSPGGEKMSKHSVPAGDIGALLARFSEIRQKAATRIGRSFPIIVIQEAGLDGFWIDRVLESEGIESHVVDPASIATSRRRRRARDPTESMARRCFARCWLTGAANLSVRDGQGANVEEEDPAPALPRAHGADNERVCTSTGSKDCCSRRAYLVMSRYVVIDGNGSTS